MVKDISNKIREIRESKGLNQAEVADILNVERQTYHYLEKRGEKLSLEQIQKIANALQVPVREILFEKSQEEPNSIASLEFAKEFEMIKRERDLLARELSDLKKDFEKEREFISTIKQSLVETLKAELVRSLFYSKNEEEKTEITQNVLKNWSELIITYIGKEEFIKSFSLVEWKMVVNELMKVVNALKSAINPAEGADQITLNKFLEKELKRLEEL